MPPAPRPFDYAALPAVDAHGRDLRQQRHALQENLRTEHGPVAPAWLAGPPVHMVLGYDAALTVLRHRGFSSDATWWSRYEHLSDPALLAAVCPGPTR